MELDSETLFAGQLQGPTFSLIGADHFGQRTLGLELGAGSAQHFQADIVARVVYCCSVFLFLPVQAGDTISGEVELLLYPKKESATFSGSCIPLLRGFGFCKKERTACSVSSNRSTPNFCGYYSSRCIVCWLEGEPFL